MPYRNRLLVLVLLGAMDAATGFALLAGAGIVDADPLHGQLFWLILLIIWFGTASQIALAAEEELSPRTLVGVVMAALLACIIPPLVLVHGDIGGIMLSAFLLGLFLWRGMLITPRHTDHYEVQRRFALRLGLILLGIIVLVARGDTEKQSLWLMLSLLGITYVVAGLAALGLSRLEEAQPETDRDSGTAAVFAPLALLVLLSLGALALVSANFFGLIASALGPIWDVITGAIALLLTVLALPLYFLALLTRHIRLPTRKPLFHLPPRKQPHTVPPGPGHHALTAWDYLGSAAVVILALVLALVIVALILRATRARKPREREPDADEEHRALATPTEMVRLFFAWLRGLFRRSAETVAFAVEASRRRVLGPSYPSDPVRRIYAQVLYRAARQGLPRPPTTTPAEFVPQLQRRWPDGEAQFSAVTEAYERRRYAELVVSEEEVRTIRHHWQDLRKIMRAPSHPAGR